MRRAFGVTLFFGVAVAIVAGTCVAFAMLMAPAEIKPIVAAKTDVSERSVPAVPVALIEQKMQGTVGSVRAASAATPISKEEPKSAKLHHLEEGCPCRASESPRTAVHL